jgi:hypothetical protein
LLQKGGILEITDPSVVHVVQVSSPGESHTLRWRVYVPDGRTVALNARADSVPANKSASPRLPPNNIVVADRAAPNPIQLGPGEHVVTLVSELEDRTPRPGFERYIVRLDVVGDGSRTGKVLRSRDSDLLWLHFAYGRDITQVELGKTTAQKLREGRTLTLADGKTFVLGRLHYLQSRGTPMNSRASESPTTMIQASEILVWLHPDEP